MLTQEFVRHVLDYHPEEGILRWRLNGSGRRGAGSVAGYISICRIKGKRDTRYVRVCINGRRYMAHTVIWLWITGDWLPRLIDHRDCDGANNRWSNLRIATKFQNSGNRRARVDNALGIKGVHRSIHPHRRRRPFTAQIRLNGKTKTIGRFATAEEASAAYARAAECQFGEFARVK